MAGQILLSCGGIVLKMHYAKLLRVNGSKDRLESADKKKKKVE